jgi:hypothetical protein
MISAGPPALPAMTGFPSAIASTTTIPNGSRSDACTITSIACIQRGTSPWYPAKVTASDTPRSAANVRSSSP